MKPANTNRRTVFFFVFFAPQARDKITIPCHLISYLYQKYMGAVDQLDRDISDWGISRRSRHWPHRVANWLYDCNSANDYRIATYREVADRPADFKKYVPGKLKNCRMVFQMTKGLAKIKLGILKDCPSFLTDPGAKRPTWMRQQAWVPCGCGKCVFCKAGYCTGIAHPPVQVTKKRKAATKDCTHHKDIDRGTAKCSLCSRRFRAMPKNASKKPAEINNMRHKAAVECLGCGRKMCRTCAGTHAAAAAAN